MPNVERDKNTGALIFHKTPTEKKLDEVEERLERLEKLERIEKLENAMEMETSQEVVKPKRGRKPIKKEVEA